MAQRMDEDDEASWEEPVEESLPTLCLLCVQVLSSPEAVLAHLQADHGVALLQLVTRLGTPKDEWARQESKRTTVAEVRGVRVMRGGACCFWSRLSECDRAYGSEIRKKDTSVRTKQKQFRRKRGKRRKRGHNALAGQSKSQTRVGCDVHACGRGVWNRSETVESKDRATR